MTDPLSPRALLERSVQNLRAVRARRPGRSMSPYDVRRKDWQDALRAAEDDLTLRLDKLMQAHELTPAEEKRALDALQGKPDPDAQQRAAADSHLAWLVAEGYADPRQYLPRTPSQDAAVRTSSLPGNIHPASEARDFSAEVTLAARYVQHRRQGTDTPEEGEAFVTAVERVYAAARDSWVAKAALDRMRGLGVVATRDGTIGVTTPKGTAPTGRRSLKKPRHNAARRAARRRMKSGELAQEPTRYAVNSDGSVKPVQSRSPVRTHQAGAGTRHSSVTNRDGTTVCNCGWSGKGRQAVRAHLQGRR